MRWRRCGGTTRRLGQCRRLVRAFPEPHQPRCWQHGYDVETARDVQSFADALAARSPESL